MISVLTPWRSKRETHHTSKKSVIKTVKSVIKKEMENQTMKIELFYRYPTPDHGYRGRESLIEFEERVNDFMADKQVIDIKIQGNDAEPFLMVMYNETN